MLRLRWRQVAVPFRNVVANAQASYRVRESVLFELEAAGGIRGIGEAALPAGSSFARHGESIEAFITATASRLRRADPTQGMARVALPPQTPGSWSAALVCGVETALADLAARAAGVPLYHWLATCEGIPVFSGDGEVEVNGLVDLVDPAAAARQAAGLAAEGFRTIKLKVGGDPIDALATVAAVRAAAGPGVTLRCDANGSWALDDARQFLEGCQPHAVALCEEPLADPGAEYSSLAVLRESSPVPLALDESTRTVAALDEAIAAGAADLLVVKPMASGLGEALAMLARARKAGIPVIVTTTFDLAPGTAVTLHVAALAGSPPLACGLATLGLVENSLGSGVPPVVEGRMRLPDEPGMGVNLDAASVDRYAIGGWREVEP